MASITINTTAEQDARIQAAFRSILNLDHDPNVAEVKAALIAWLRGSVLDYERRIDMAAFVPNPIDPT